MAYGDVAHRSATRHSIAFAKASFGVSMAAVKVTSPRRPWIKNGIPTSKNTPPGSKYNVPAAPCTRLGPCNTQS